MNFYWFFFKLNPFLMQLLDIHWKTGGVYPPSETLYGFQTQAALEKSANNLMLLNRNS
jgi:hypothetical protein